MNGQDWYLVKQSFFCICIDGPGWVRLREVENGNNYFLTGQEMGKPRCFPYNFPTHICPPVLQLNEMETKPFPPTTI